MLKGHFSKAEVGFINLVAAHGYRRDSNFIRSMNVDPLTSVKLHSLFVKHGFEKKAYLSGIVRYTSKLLAISIVNNPKECTNTLWIGRNHSQAIEIDDQVMQEHFHSDLKLNNLSLEMFIDRVFVFFSSQGKRLLEGDESALISLEKFNEQRSFEYTNALLVKQKLSAARQAWQDGNYIDVVRHLETIIGEKLPASFKQMYSLAKKKLSS